MDDKCHVVLFTKEVVLEAAEETQVITLYITGMGCFNCANRVHNSLIGHPSVIAAAVSHVMGKAEVAFIPAKVSIPQLIRMVERASDHWHTYRAVGSRFWRQGEQDEYFSDIDDFAHVAPITPT